MTKAKSLNKNIVAKVKANQKKAKVAVMAAKKSTSLFDKILGWFR
jgi:hypothetical protein